MSQLERDRQPTGWAMAYRFRDADAAKRTYEAVRDGVLVEDDAEASVFRFMIGDAHYVALVAQEAPRREHERQAEALMARHGAPASIPDDVLEHLLERRRAFKSTRLDYLERRT